MIPNPVILLTLRRLPRHIRHNRTSNLPGLRELPQILSIQNECEMRAAGANDRYGPCRGFRPRGGQPDQRAPRAATVARAKPPCVGTNLLLPRFAPPL